MKFEEVLPALREGKKIRRNNWCKDGYIYINSNGEFENQSGKRPAIILSRLDDLEADNREIVKEKKKIKLRDLTEEQFEKWSKNNCTHKYGVYCVGCPFDIVNCADLNDNFWINHKDLFSDKFLDQEVEVEE